MNSFIKKLTLFFLLVAGNLSAQSFEVSLWPGPAPGSEDWNYPESVTLRPPALACVHKEYPNQLSHTLNGDADVATPRKLAPAFYGCYDWHSSVHGHWLLVRLVRSFPNADFAQPAREALRESLSAEHITQEAAYLRAEGRASFERPYGLAWLLQLVAELREWHDPEAKEMATDLHPLEEAALARLNDWLPKLSHPVRIGEHYQTRPSLSA